MPVTHRMLIGAIAGNPGQFQKDGEYCYCLLCEAIYLTSAKAPDQVHSDHRSLPLPALNPDGSSRLSDIFKEFIKRWTPERQDELERFALRKGWDLARELRYGGGALTDEETAEWQVVVNQELERLAQEARTQIDAAI